MSSWTLGKILPYILLLTLKKRISQRSYICHMTFFSLPLTSPAQNTSVWNSDFVPCPVRFLKHEDGTHCTVAKFFGNGIHFFLWISLSIVSHSPLVFLFLLLWTTFNKKNNFSTELSTCFTQYIVLWTKIKHNWLNYVDN